MASSWERVRVGDLQDVVPYDGRVEAVAGKGLTYRGDGGTVTGAVGAGVQLHPGDQVAVIDEAPVVVLAGAVPMYRDLLPSPPVDGPAATASDGAGTGGSGTVPGAAPGTPDTVAAPPTTVSPVAAPALHGRDVAQLQMFLAGQGFDVGPIDGVLGAKVQRAARRWRTDHGMRPDDGFALGELVFVDQPEPWRVAKVDAGVGAPATSGDALVDLGGGQVTVAATLDEPPATDSRFRALIGDGPARPLELSGEAKPDDQGKFTVTLTAKDPAGLKPGTTVVLEVYRTLRKRAVIVPVGAVAMDGAGHTVVRYRDGTSGPGRKQKVTLGPSTDANVAVKGIDGTGWVRVYA